MYELLRELPSDLRLRTFRNWERSGKSQNIELSPSAQLPATKTKKKLPILAKNH